MSDLAKEATSEKDNSGAVHATNVGPNECSVGDGGTCKQNESSASAGIRDAEKSHGSKRRWNKANPYGCSKRKRGKEGGRGPSEESKKTMRRKDDDDPANLVPNSGSYAHPAMQELFGVKVEKKNPPAAVANNEDSTSNSKAPKKKVALLVAFLGEAYSGMQINTGTRTIQGEIDFALYKAGYLSQANFGFPQKYSWSNSARTDKGVHACAQVCSLKIELPAHTMDTVRHRINAELPDDVRVLDVCRTTRNFCARTQRCRARYMYMIPSHVLYERNELRALFEAEGCTSNGRPAADPLSEDEIEALRPAMVRYRAKPDGIERLRRSLASFEGTHSFHNFTNGKTSSDPSCSRYIESFAVLDPVVSDKGMEWIPTLVLGQSFLLHQIRKMVSLAIDAARGATVDGTLEDSMAKERQMILSLAPAQGLFLEMSFFGQYNKRKKPDEPLDWVTKETPAVKRWRDFRDQRIMKHIMEEEWRESNFLKYIFQQEYHFDRKRYLPLDFEQKEKSATKSTGEEPESKKS